MRSNVVRRSELLDGAGSRLDAEAFDPTYLEPEQRLIDRGGCRLSDLAYQLPSSRSLLTDESGSWDYIDISSVDNRDGFLLPSEYLTADLPSRAYYQVSDGDLLVSNVRPQRGAISLVSDDLDGSFASSGFTCVRPTSGAISSSVLFAWLRSDHVQRQLVRRSRNSMYPAVSPSDVLDVWVPTIPKALAERVESRVKLALEARREFLEAAAKASEVLTEFLQPYGAPPSPLDAGREGVEQTIVQRSDCFGAGNSSRIDVEFHRSEFVDFSARLRSLGPWTSLGELYALRSGAGRSSGSSEASVIKQAVLTNLGVNWSAAEVEEGRSGARAELKGGELLIASAAHEVYYVGRKVDYVREVPTSHSMNEVVAELIVGRQRSASSDHRVGAFVAAFLRSEAGLHQVQRCIRGLRGGHIYGSDLELFVDVPVPSEEWLDAFGEFSLAAELSRNSALDCVRDAVRLLEDEFWRDAE